MVAPPSHPFPAMFDWTEDMEDLGALCETETSNPGGDCDT